MVGTKSLSRVLIITLVSLMWQTPHGTSSGSSDNLIMSQSIVSETKEVFHLQQDSASSIPQMVGRIRFHYDMAVSSCDYVLLLGVGTFMSVSEYDNLSRALSSHQNLVVVIMDHNVHNLEKTSSTKFAALANEIVFQLDSLVPICTHGQAKFMLGGHSASGQAAMQGWQQGLFSTMPWHPIGFLGLDPYEISNHTMADNIMMNLPGLYWGFTSTTCLVAVEKAAKAAYNRTKVDARVLYVIHNDHDSTISHCVFTDQGCGFAQLGCGTTASTTSNSVYTMVAASVQRFLQALNLSRPFNHDTFTFPEYSDEEVDILVNSDLWDYEHKEVSFLF